MSTMFFVGLSVPTFYLFFPDKKVINERLFLEMSDGFCSQEMSVYGFIQKIKR